VWLYRVDHPGAGPELGATHTVEVPLVFGTWRDGEAGQRLAGQAAGADAVSSALVAVWGAFLRGEPLPWAALSQGRGERGVFGGAAPYVTEALLTEFISE
jgi:carboxylesterase type B